MFVDTDFQPASVAPGVLDEYHAIQGLEVELAEVAGTLNLAHARLVELMQRALESGAWRGDRIHSPGQWLAWRTGLSPFRAAEIVRIAERRGEFPIVIGAFDRGELAVDQVAVVAKNAPGWADARVLDLTKAATVAQLRSVMRSDRFDDGPQAGSAPVTPTERLSTGHGEGGRWRISGELDTDRGEFVQQALAEAKDALFDAGDTTVTWADALVEVCRRSLASVASVSRRDRYRVMIHLDADADATLTAGWRVPQSIRDRILCDGVVNPVWERNSHPINVGRAQHIVPDRTRTIVERRDRGCRVPGCCASSVEVHHIVHWADGGVTDTWNLISLCPKHHRLHHQGLLGITGNADERDGVTFSDDRGRKLEASGTPTPPTQPPPTPTVPYQHPDGGRLDRNWAGLGWISDQRLQQIRARNRANWN